MPLTRVQTIALISTLGLLGACAGGQDEPAGDAVSEGTAPTGEEPRFVASYETRIGGKLQIVETSAGRFEITETIPDGAPDSADASGDSLEAIYRSEVGDDVPQALVQAEQRRRAALGSLPATSSTEGFASLADVYLPAEDFAWDYCRQEPRGACVAYQRCLTNVTGSWADQALSAYGAYVAVRTYRGVVTMDVEFWEFEGTRARHTRDVPEGSTRFFYKTSPRWFDVQARVNARHGEDAYHAALVSTRDKNSRFNYNLDAKNNGYLGCR